MIDPRLQRPERCRYRGHRDDRGCTVEVLPWRPGVVAIGYPLPHKVRHSPTGFEWGYAGSGPADLSRSLLAHHLNDQIPHPAVYQRFKAAVIQHLPRGSDVAWEITSEQIALELGGVLDAIGANCPVCLDSGYTPEDHKRCACQSGPEFCDGCGGLVGPSGCDCDSEA